MLGVAFSALAIAFISFGVVRHRQVDEAIARGGYAPLRQRDRGRVRPGRHRARDPRHHRRHHRELRCGSSGSSAASEPAAPASRRRPRRRASRPTARPSSWWARPTTGPRPCPSRSAGDIDMGPMPVGPMATLDDLEDAVRSELERAAQALGDRADVATRIEVGSLAPALEAAAGDAEGVLLALDAPLEGRMLGIIDGDAGTWLLHESSRPILLARGPEDAGGLPAGRGRRSGRLAAPRPWPPRPPARSPRRRGSELRLVDGPRPGRRPPRGRARCARGSPPTSWWRTRAARSTPSPAPAATSSSSGSRGLSGLRALGSVSERVAHGARGVGARRPLGVRRRHRRRLARKRGVEGEPDSP